MKIYRSHFASNLCGVDEICQWASEIISKRTKRISLVRFSRLIPTSAESHNAKSYHDSQTAYFSLFLFEILSNIIEHRVLCLNKMQIYHHKLRYIQGFYQQYPIYAYLSFSALRFLLCLKFSHILRHFSHTNTLKSPLESASSSQHRIYGGRGKIILKHLFAKAKYRQKYQRHQCVFILRGRLDSANLL